MLELLQLISFEVNDTCNLANKHTFCPSATLCRKGDPASNKDFLEFLYYCVKHGFKGNVAFHGYNEPTIDIDRCLFLNDRIHTLGLKSTLWSNGTYEGDLSMFDEVYITNYTGDNHNCTKSIKYAPDDRIKIYETPKIDKDNYKPCYRPETIEMPIDFNGNIHLCCADWDREVEIGNIKDSNYQELLYSWEDCSVGATSNIFNVCRRCQSLKKSPAVIVSNYKV